MIPTIVPDCAVVAAIVPDCAVVAAIILYTDICAADKVERKLIHDLLDNYDKRVRPTSNSSQALNVTFGLALAQLIDVVSEPI